MSPTIVGSVFIASLMLLGYLAFNIDKLPFAAATTYTAAFDEVAGLRAGDHVRIAGIDVGKISAIDLEQQHVRVKFTVKKGVHLGSATTASIKIFTLLGNKYLEIDPGQGGTWPADKELPLRRTTAPYDVTQAFQDLASTAHGIDSAQLARSFDTIAATFRDSPPAVRDMLSGLSRLSQTVASRDQELRELLDHAAGLTGVLADRRAKLARLLGDGDQLLQMVRSRQHVINALLTHTADLSRELRGLVADNTTTIGPMLTHLHGVTTLLEQGQANLDESIQRLFVWTRRNIDTIGGGPWFDGEIINTVNPFQLPGQLKHPAGTPTSFGELFRMPRGAG
jgi:phospholipid/cholesterol/gamma-HCH transport system substrate-binding protein